MRALTAPILLAAAVGVPYAATNGPELDQLWESSSPSDKAPAYAGLPSNSTSVNVSALPTGQFAATQQSLSLGEVIRFDVTKNWVYRRWNRKSTALAELDLFGVRVPLVTGTQLHDVAGSLTYYFDQQGIVQRIALTGRTGDTRPLEQLVLQRFGLQRQATVIAGERVYQLKSGRDVFGELRLKPAPVLVSSSPHDSFSVDMDLRRPGSQRPLPTRQLPIPAVEQQAPESEPVREDIEDQAAAAANEAEPPEQPAADSWEGYFPRSRVPKEQVERLQRRDRFW